MDKYKVLKRIGVGNNGAAYLVSLKRDANQIFVLKKVKLDDGSASTAPSNGFDMGRERAQPENEVAVLLQLDHPLVLGYVDHFVYKGHLCIITDYCEAGDLFQMLRARKVPLLEGQILELLAQILLALQYVHGKSILHRDLKTANIFLTKEGTIKLGDFGISRPLTAGLDLASTIIGTPYYMSPEVMSSQPYDFKSDMWSLGCCLYEMMTLKHAFDASDLTSLVLKVMRGEHLPIPDQFTAPLRDLAKQLLSKVPKLRPSAEQCLKMPLLKDYVARAKEKVAWLEQQRASKPRWRSPGRLDPANAGPGPAPSADLDRELQQAQERLNRIRMERDKLREQQQHVAAAAAAAMGAAAVGVVGAVGAVGPSAIPSYGGRSPTGANGYAPLLGGKQHASLLSDDPPSVTNTGRLRGGRRSLQAPGSLISGPAVAAASALDSPPRLHHQQQQLTHGHASYSSGGLTGAPLSPAFGGPHHAHASSYGGDGDLGRDRSRGRRVTRDAFDDLPSGAAGPGPAGYGAGAHAGPGGWGGGGLELAIGGAAGAGAAMSHSFDELPTITSPGPHGGSPVPTHRVSNPNMAPSPGDFKARKEARRAEENRRREAELLEARKAYFEERRTAEAKKYSSIHNSSIAGSNPGTMRSTRGHAVNMSRRESYTGSGAEVTAGSQPSSYGPPAGAYMPGFSLGHRPGGLAVGGVGGVGGGAGSSGEDEVRHTSRPRAGSYDPYAFQDFESDIGGMAQPGAAGPGAPALAGMYYAGAPLADRAAAMRGYCVSALGQPLFDLIYGALRRRVATAAATAVTHGHHGGGPGGGGGAVAGAGQADEVFRQELQSRLGPSRMQYVHLIDQLIYLEDYSHGADGWG